jgi:hypothetical protein
MFSIINGGKSVKRKIAILTVAAVVVLLGGCDLFLSLFDTAWRLRGTWVLDHAKTTPDESSYNQFIVHRNNTYEITGFLQDIIETADMRNVSETSFESTILTQTLYPYIIGEQTYARWAVSDGELSCTFYADATMATRYITFVGRRK